MERLHRLTKEAINYDVSVIRADPESGVRGYGRGREVILRWCSVTFFPSSELE